MYTCTVNYFCVHLYCKLFLCTPVLQTGFCVHMYCKHISERNVQGDQHYTQNQFTDQIILTYKTSNRNVQGTDITSKMNVQGMDITQNLVLFTHVLLTYFVYSCTVNLFCVHLYSKLVLQTNLL